MEYTEADHTADFLDRGAFVSLIWPWAVVAYYCALEAPKDPIKWESPQARQAVLDWLRRYAGDGGRTLRWIEGRENGEPLWVQATLDLP